MPNIETIFIHNTGHAGQHVLGIDENGQLYWDGRRLVTEQRVKLDVWVNTAIILGGISAAVAALFTALEYFK